MVLYLLRYATDERYLTLLESYFGNIEDYPWTISSWTILAFTQRYVYDTQVLPYLREAQEAIEKHFGEAQRRVQKKLGRVRITREEFLHSEPWFRGANAWVRQKFAEAELRIRQQVQLRPQGASHSVAEENERRRVKP